MPKNENIFNNDDKSLQCILENERKKSNNYLLEALNKGDII